MLLMEDPPLLLVSVSSFLVSIRNQGFKVGGPLVAAVLEVGRGISEPSEFQISSVHVYGEANTKGTTPALVNISKTDQKLITTTINW